MTDHTHPIPTLEISAFSENAWEELPQRPQPSHPDRMLRNVCLVDPSFDGLAFSVEAISHQDAPISSSMTFDPPTGALRPADFDTLATLCTHVYHALVGALVGPRFSMPVEEFTAQAWWEIPRSFEGDTPDFWVRSLHLVVDSDLDPSVWIDVTSSSCNATPLVLIDHADDDLYPAEARSLVPALEHVNTVIDEIIRHPHRDDLSDDAKTCPRMPDEEHPVDALAREHDIPEFPVHSFSPSDWRALPTRPVPDHPDRHVREALLTDTTLRGAVFRVHLSQSAEVDAPVIATVLPTDDALDATDPAVMGHFFEQVSALLRGISAVSPPTMSAFDLDDAVWAAVPIHHDPDDRTSWTRSIDLLAERDLGPAVTIRLTSTSRSPIPTARITPVDDELYPTEMRALASALAHINEVTDNIVHRPPMISDEEDTE